MDRLPQRIMPAPFLETPGKSDRSVLSGIWLPPVCFLRYKQRPRHPPADKWSANCLGSRPRFRVDRKAPCLHVRFLFVLHKMCSQKYQPATNNQFVFFVPSLTPKVNTSSPYSTR